MSQGNARQGACGGAARNHDEREFQIMNDDLPIRESKRFQNRNLFPLQCQQPRNHRVDHERCHAQKHHRESDRHRGEHPDFIRDPNVGGMIGAAVSATPAISCEQTVQLRYDRPFGSVGRQRH